MKTIWQMIKLKVINNQKLWICCLCIVAMALLCFLSPFPSGDPDEKETVLKVWLNIDREQLLQMDEMASIYSVAAGFRNMEWFVVFFRVNATIQCSGFCLFLFFYNFCSQSCLFLKIFF